MAFSAITKIVCVQYMDYLFLQKHLEGRSWNNHLKFMRAFFNWCIEKCYCNENHFIKIKPKRQSQKKRILIPENVRKRIIEYCERNNPNYIIVCELVFSALIRPKEISMIRIADVNLSQKYIYISETNAKTHNSRIAALSPDLCRRLAALELDKRKPTDYLIGHGYVPSAKKVVLSRFRKDWDVVRKALNLPQEMQLYSLRDTGINSMLKAGIDPLTVMQHADHHDLKMTTRYANHVDPHLVETINKEAPEF